ncbi:MAG: D-alanyl-D-alanine carboxypeptidase [Ruminococcaceae bacterium]|nr:D-alanyl-D-alanine carboxypeptidase [Oscillospiraceae bacterium]
MGHTSFRKKFDTLKCITALFLLAVVFSMSFLSPVTSVFAAEDQNFSDLIESEDNEKKVSYILYETNCNQIITKQNSDASVNASLIARMMTCYIALENFSLTDSIVATESSKSYSGGYSITKNRAYSVDTLVKAALIGNADNATRLLAEQLCNKKSLTKEQYITAMNDKAASLNMKNTVFATSDGSYNEFQITTVYDTALFLATAVKNTRFLNIYCAPAVLVWDNIIISNPHDLVIEENNSASVSGGTVAVFDNNELNNEYTSTFYQKANAKQKDKDYSLIFVSSGVHLDTSMELTKLALNDINNNYNLSLLVKAGDKINTIKTEVGEISLAAGKTTYCVTPVDREDFIKHTNYIYESGYNPDEIKDQIKSGTVVGQVQYQLDDGTTIQIPLVTIGTQEIRQSRVDTIYEILSNNGKYRNLFILIAILFIFEIIIIVYVIYWKVTTRNK